MKGRRKKARMPRGENQRGREQGGAVKERERTVASRADNATSFPTVVNDNGRSLALVAGFEFLCVEGVGNGGSIREAVERSAEWVCKGSEGTTSPRLHSYHPCCSSSPGTAMLPDVLI